MSLALTPYLTFGQNSCDSVQIFKTKFDREFQNEYDKINSDSVLALTRCESTNGCYNQLGLLAWKSDDELTIKILVGHGNQIISNMKVSKQTEDLIDQFFNDKIYTMNDKLEMQYFIDDGPATYVFFKTKGNCWTYSHALTNSKDVRVIWTDKLLNELRK